MPLFSLYSWELGALDFPVGWGRGGVERIFHGYCCQGDSFWILTCSWHLWVLVYDHGREGSCVGPAGQEGLPQLPEKAACPCPRKLPQKALPSPHAGRDQLSIEEVDGLGEKMEMNRKWEPGWDQWPPRQELLVRVSLSQWGRQATSLSLVSVSPRPVSLVHFLTDSALRSGLESTRGTQSCKRQNQRECQPHTEPSRHRHAQGVSSGSGGWGQRHSFGGRGGGRGLGGANACPRKTRSREEKDSPGWSVSPADSAGLWQQRLLGLGFRQRIWAVMSISLPLGKRRNGSRKDEHTAWLWGAEDVGQCLKLRRAIVVPGAFLHAILSPQNISPKSLVGACPLWSWHREGSWGSKG